MIHHAAGFPRMVRHNRPHPNHDIPTSNPGSHGAIPRRNFQASAATRGGGQKTSQQRRTGRGAGGPNSQERACECCCCCVCPCATLLTPDSWEGWFQGVGQSLPKRCSRCPRRDLCQRSLARPIVPPHQTGRETQFRSIDAFPALLMPCWPSASILSTHN